MKELGEWGNGEAEYYQRVELVNFLKTYVEGCIKYRRRWRARNVACLKEELKRPVYGDVSSLFSGVYGDKEAVLAIAGRDAAGFYRLMERRYEELPLKHKIRDKFVKCIKKLLIAKE